MMMQVLWFLLGLILAALFMFFARSQGVHRERMILAQGLLIAAIIYVGFAAVWGNRFWIAVEVGGLLIYGLFAFLALRYTIVWLAVGWAAHPFWDIFLHWMGQGHIIAPEWYVIACLSFDLLVAGYLFICVNRWRDASPRVRFGRI